ncbi:MAG: carboxylating nicotinate-nucleotide diphosphorylase [Oscillospiraceae bacterium]|nr:carboxylating nicotinate-nucleotide diphosphorylase [Oscillospiraceae bacterium]
MILPQFYVDDLIKKAIMEDINYIDVATDYLLDENHISESYFVAKAEGILCGIDVAMRVFELLDDTFEYTLYKRDGDKVQNGDLIAEFKGKTVRLLKGERTALNLLQHMSGIATLTNECVKETEGTNATIADTRKTLPGIRTLQKYAVTCGGGRNHRYNLSDCAMLKDNHIDAKGGITPAVKALREKIGHTVKIEVETRTLAEVQEAVNAGADIIMLDNMDNDTMKKAVEIVNGKALLEASGNLTKERIRSVSEIGVDILSIGALTHSVAAFDISMKMKNE